MYPVGLGPSDPNVPWQLRWKRPKLVESLHDVQLDGMIPIDSKSARLTADEACSIIEYVNNPSNNIDPLEEEGTKNYHFDTTKDKMKWEDLESSSDEDEDDTFNRDRPQEEQYLLTVTILASEASVKLLETLQDKNFLIGGDAKELLPADSIYLEVVKDSSTFLDQNSEDDFADTREDGEQVTVITSKLLHWPSSTFINVETHNTPNMLREEVFNAVRKALNRTESQTESIEEVNYHLHHKLEQKAKLLRQRIGVTSLALARRKIIDHNDEKLDFDDMCEILDRIAFGTLSKSEYLHLSPDKGFYDTSNIQPQRQEQNDDKNELVLSCVTNDGKVYLFSALEILIRPAAKLGSKPNKSPKEKNPGGDTFTGEFETLLFGRELQNKLEEKILPLSEPKGCIALSVVSGITSDEINEETNGEKISAEDQDSATIQQSKEEASPQENYFLDFSFLDSNIEARTIHYRTIRNIPTICVAAYEHIVIGGKGMRKEKRKRKFPTDEFGDERKEEFHHQGGFISFISLSRLNEDKTLFLPFPPKLISPVRFSSMELVIITGRDGECLAIRTDSSSIIPSHSKYDKNLDVNPLFVDFQGKSCLDSQSMLVEKFSLVDISLSLNEGCDDGSKKVAIPLSVTSRTTNPPCVVSYYFNGPKVILRLHQMVGFGLKQNQDFPQTQAQIDLMAKQRNDFPPKTILCAHEDRHNVQIALPFLTKHDRNHKNLMDNSWCTCGNGWSLLGLEYKGNLEVYFILWEGAKDAAFYRNILSDRSSNYYISNILPVSVLDTQREIIDKNPVMHASLRSFSSDSVPSNSDDNSHDAIIRSVIEEIKNQNTPLHPSIMSNLLLAKCRSWTQLNEKRGNTDEQFAVATITYSGKNYILTLRGLISKSPATPFQEIISWLCQHKDYYTAASVALHLLDDIETIQDLTGYDCTFSRDILDGIVPVKLAFNNSSNKGIGHDLSNNTRLDKKILSTITSLADMTVVCLVKDHSIKALDAFLHRNRYYNASRACLILGASTAFAVSQISHLEFVENLASFSFNPLMSQTHTLWPIRCLLSIAVTRKYTPNVLLLLNATIPHEMRNISSGSQTCSISLCKSIVSMILASSTDSAGILLNLVHQGSPQNTYWNSISTSTRFELSLLQIQGKFPLLLEIEVRQWALQLLHKATGLVASSRSEIDLPTAWLQKLCLACLHNAECDFSLLDFDIPTEEKDGRDIFSQFENEEAITRKIIASGQHDIDFDLLIPSLLLLANRNSNWSNDIIISSQSLLNMASYMAGRPTSDETGFTFDSALVTKQCALMGNIGAAANLVGGNDGIILKCANVVTFGDVSRIQEAEEFLIGKRDDVFFMKRTDFLKSTDDFVLTRGHCEVLWYLKKIVFNTRKYGDFLSVSPRGNTDPTFAARVCLRAWLSLCRSVIAPYPASGKWLEQWLEKQLQTSALARAALTHCLLWTEIRNSNNEKTVLAESLGLSAQFLVMITKKASHGLLSVV